MIAVSYIFIVSCFSCLFFYAVFHFLYCTSFYFIFCLFFHSHFFSMVFLSHFFLDLLSFDCFVTHFFFFFLGFPGVIIFELLRNSV